MSVMTDIPEKPKKSRIPLLFFAFFGVVLAANMTMVYFAMSSWTGLETRNHYLKGLNYNEALEGAERQAGLGWHVEMAVVEAADRTITVEHRLKDRDARPLSGADIRVTFIRPTHTGYDVQAKAIELRPGVYRATGELPLYGQWEVRHVIRLGEDAHQGAQRITVTEP